MQNIARSRSEQSTLAPYKHSLLSPPVMYLAHQQSSARKISDPTRALRHGASRITAPIVFQLIGEKPGVRLRDFRVQPTFEIPGTSSARTTVTLICLARTGRFRKGGVSFRPRKGGALLSRYAIFLCTVQDLANALFASC